MAGPDINDKEHQAVEHTGGPLLVLAGPGTGKNWVLVGRIATSCLVRILSQSLSTRTKPMR